MDFKKVMLSLAKDLKAKFGIHVQHARCENSGENKILKRLANRKGWTLTSSTLY